MAQEQTKNSPTNNNAQTTPVSFDDVSLDTLRSSFNETYKVSKGSASQVVLGFRAMAERLQNPQNEYQQELYPQLKQTCLNVYNKYNDTFLTTFTNSVERQVFGANLNGNRNSGSLYRSIPSGVNRNLTYNYAQFGQLLRVLSGRLRFVVNRDSESVQRYKDSADEGSAYQKLQTKSTEFLTYLETVSGEWDSFVKATRSKYSVEEPERKERPQRAQRPQREQRQNEQRPRRTYTSQNEQRPRREHKEYKPVRKAENATNEDWQQVRPKRYTKSS